MDQLESTHAGVSRRSTHMFSEELDSIEIGSFPGGGALERSYASSNSSTTYDEKDYKGRECRSSSANDVADGYTQKYLGDGLTKERLAAVDLGRDISSLFPQTAIEMEREVAMSMKGVKELSQAKAAGHPSNFGVVLPGAIYRSSFPQPEDLPFLITLGLKCIVTLVDKEPSEAFTDFMKLHGIRHLLVDFPTTKVGIPDSTMKAVMKIALDQANHPLLLHCNHGKHRTGCAAAIIRKLAGWGVTTIVEEYSGFAEPKVRECDVKYIIDYHIASLEGLFHNTSLHPSGRTLATSRNARLICAAALLILIWCSVLSFWDRK